MREEETERAGCRRKVPVFAAVKLAVQGSRSCPRSNRGRGVCKMIAGRPTQQDYQGYSPPFTSPSARRQRPRSSTRFTSHVQRYPARRRESAALRPLLMQWMIGGRPGNCGYQHLIARLQRTFARVRTSWQSRSGSPTSLSWTITAVPLAVVGGKTRFERGDLLAIVVPPRPIVLRMAVRAPQAPRGRCQLVKHAPSLPPAQSKQTLSTSRRAKCPAWCQK